VALDAVTRKVSGVRRKSLKNVSKLMPKKTGIRLEDTNDMTVSLLSCEEDLSLNTKPKIVRSKSERRVHNKIEK